MILDYIETTDAYVLRVKRDEGVDTQALLNHHGLDLSAPRSTPREAVFFTHEPYAAVTFWDHATPAARGMLQRLHDQIASSWKDDSDMHFDMPSDKELWPFQRACLEYVMPRTHCMIADQPGLGKTPDAIVLANTLQAHRNLVICPANIRLQWAAKIQEWSTTYFRDRVVHPILNGRHGVHPTAEWNIVSYDLARSQEIGRALASVKWDLLILDEAHYLKTIDSRRTRAIFGGGEGRTFEPIAEQASRVLALTGTPLPNRPREAYTLARALCFDALDWMSEDKFNERFNPSRLMTTEVGGEIKRFVVENTGRHYELQNRLRAHLMVRHMKHEVLSQLHLPVFDIVRMEETSAIRSALAAERLLDIDPEHLEGADMAILGHVAAVRRQMGVAMAPGVADYVAMLLDGGEAKLVVFAWHIEVLDILEARLAKHGVLRIDGTTIPTRKQKIVDKFIADKRINVLIGNIQSMGTGTDGLQNVSTHALIAEPSWTPGENQQAVDRLDRIGQKGQVQCDFLVAPGSIAERVLASALRKLQTTDRALDSTPFGGK